MTEPLQVLRPDGSVVRPDLVPTDSSLLERLYREMRRIRHFDDRADVLQKQGRLGVYPFFGGQEGAQVGCALALEPGDWLVPSYRESGAALVFGMPMWRVILTWRAHLRGYEMDPDLRVVPFYIPIANQIPHTTGIALAGKLRGEKTVAMGFIGDGGTSEGDFHVGINFAGALAAPAVFVVQNNGWAISVPTHLQTAATSIASRAEGYGIAGARVDGNDALATYHVAREAVARARTESKPTLIEAMTYRVKPHTTSDDPSRYRSEDEARVWLDERAPLKRLRVFLEREGLWSEPREREWLDACEHELQDALARADAAATEVEPWEILEHVYATPTPTLHEQIATLRGGHHG